jgi:hypothetical protein
MSIRTKILAGVVLINLIGAVCVAVYLHTTFSGGLDVSARQSVTLTKGAWEDITSRDAARPGFADYAKSARDALGRMKRITGGEYGLLLLKSAGDPKEYAAIRSAGKLPDNWNEGETYVLAGVTDESFSGRMQLKATPDAVPDIGKVVGIENGACSKTCHNSVKGHGDFWGVDWSTDAHSRAHIVVPVVDAAGKPIGLVYGISDISAQANADRSSLVSTLLVIVFGLVSATVLIWWLLNALVFSRLTHMITTMEDIGERVAGGDFEAHFQPDGSTDEIGEFEEFFAKFLDLVSGMLKSLMRKGA